MSKNNFGDSELIETEVYLDSYYCELVTSANSL